jgi:ATP-dependent RNA helicase SUPV3L1/SUV3
LPASFYDAIGLRALDGLALRPDRLEQIAAAARHLARRGPFAADAEIAGISAIRGPALRRVLRALGYGTVVHAGKEKFVRRSRNRRDIRERPRKAPAGDGHPFAKLRELNLV